jgi:N-acetylmuramic acid 6-phosphate etherase
MTDLKKSGPFFLGIEGGGTRTIAICADAEGKLVCRNEAGPANVRLLNDVQLRLRFKELGSSIPTPASIAIGLAGAREEKDRQRIRDAAAKVWPNVPCVATHDLDTALEAAPETSPRALPRILILSGTGSCCYGKTPKGKVTKFGGWGHILGDKGSGFEIGLRALKAVVYYYDKEGEWSKLGQRLLRSLQLNEPNDLIAWVQKADKTEIASLAKEVFDAWHLKDKIATDILTGAAHSLAKDAIDCSCRLVGPGHPIQFVLAGSVLIKQPRFAKMVGRHLKQAAPACKITPLAREGAWGAVELARKVQPFGKSMRRPAIPSAALHSHNIPSPPKLSPTEHRHPASMNLDRLSLGQAIELMLDEDAKLSAAILRVRDEIEKALRLIIRSLKRGGRLFYVGAGTSGRLGVLDASECPPTFRTPPDMVQAIIAGGQRAIWQAVEGAEDDRNAGARAVRFRGVTNKDVVIGIAASGRTPYVWGALQEARDLGAATGLVCFNPHVIEESAANVDVIIAPGIGPEILTGSTRLKAGTATKLILNIFTTLAMVQLGKVMSNLMVDLNPSNVKLRDRAIRIVQQLMGVEHQTAKMALERSNWVVKDAYMRLRRNSKGLVRESSKMSGTG